MVSKTTVVSLDMTDEPFLDEKAQEAVHAARDAAQAIEVVRQQQIDTASDNAAAKAAALAAEKMNEKIVDETRMAEIMREQVTHVLAQGSDRSGMMILARVPYICQNIVKIDENMEKMGEKVDKLKDAIEARLKEERVVSNKNYAPILAWTILLGILGIFGLAIAGNIAKFFIPPIPSPIQVHETTQ